LRGAAHAYKGKRHCWGARSCKFVILLFSGRATVLFAWRPQLPGTNVITFARLLHQRIDMVARGLGEVGPCGE